MTDTERKALALAIETRVGDRYRLCPDPTLTFGLWEALCRAIEQHEAFRQEVSDAVVKATHTMAAGGLFEASGILAALIIAKPDPLVEVLDECGFGVSSNAADDIRAAIEKRGGKIVWGEG